MSKTNETKNETVTSLYRVNYQYIAKDGSLRAGAIVIDTTSAEEAKKEATTRLSTSNFAHPRITNIKIY